MRSTLNDRRAEAREPGESTRNARQARSTWDALCILWVQEEEAVRRFALWKHRRRVAGIAVPSPSPQDAYAELMRTAFAPFLREQGLRGSSGRFELPSDTHWAQLGFQKSAYSDRLELRFTINLSVISREEWARQREARPFLGTRPTPTITYGSWADQERIGMLTTQPGDKWWHILTSSDITLVRDDVLADLGANAIPWLRARVAA